MIIFLCRDLSLGFYCPIQVKFLRSMQWSLFYGSLNMYTFFDSPSITIITGWKTCEKPVKKVKYVKFTCENYIFKFHMLFEM